MSRKPVYIDAKNHVFLKEKAKSEGRTIGAQLNQMINKMRQSAKK